LITSFGNRSISDRRISLVFWVCLLPSNRRSTIHPKCDRATSSGDISSSLCTVSLNTLFELCVGSTLRTVVRLTVLLNVSNLVYKEGHFCQESFLGFMRTGYAGLFDRVYDNGIIVETLDYNTRPSSSTTAVTNRFLDPLNDNLTPG
jgi:hypothetical protein